MSALERFEKVIFFRNLYFEPTQKIGHPSKLYSWRFHWKLILKTKICCSPCIQFIRKYMFSLLSPLFGPCIKSLAWNCLFRKCFLEYWCKLIYKEEEQLYNIYLGPWSGWWLGHIKYCKQLVWWYFLRIREIELEEERLLFQR